MEYFFLFVALLIIVAALSYFAFFKRKKKPPVAESRPALVNCPLCGSPLQKGQNIFTKVYRPMNVHDQRCTINGCPHCFPVCETGVKRICPVCQKNLPADGHLVARLFNRMEGKKHVMIVGCFQCLKNEVT